MAREFWGPLGDRSAGPRLPCPSPDCNTGPGYPFTPLVYLLASLAVAAASTLQSPWQSLLGLALLAAGAPFYLYFRARLAPRDREEAATADPS